MKRNDVLQVSYHERLVGTLALTADHKAAFQYSEKWIFDQSIFPSAKRSGVCSQQGLF